MKLNIQVKPGSKNDEVKISDSANYLIRTKAKAVENRANKEAIRLLGRYLKIPQSKMRIVRGLKNKNKVVEILD
ncbi:MAG TPA: DUF167 domain-containing protein [Candidatus Paceibacterota bacterium]